MPQQDLDAAVKKLIESGASDDDVVFFIKNYKPEAPAETQPVAEVKAEPVKTTATKKPSLLNRFTATVLGGAGDPYSLLQRANEFLVKPAIEPHLSEMTAQLSGEKPGVLNPNLEQNPLLLKSALPETTAEPGIVGGIRHGIYENLIRPMASPLGAFSTFGVGNPAEIPMPAMPKGNLANIATASAKKPRLRLNSDKTYTNLDTGEIFDSLGKPVTQSESLRDFQRRTGLSWSEAKRQHSPSADPNFAQGAGDPMLAGSVPYKQAKPTLFHGTQNTFDNFDTSKNQSHGLFSKMNRFTEDPEYADLYSLNETGSGMKRQPGIPSEGRPNTIAAQIGTDNILDLTKPISQEHLVILQKQFPELAGAPSPEFIQSVLSTTSKSIPFDAIRYSEHGKINWAVKPEVNTKTPWGTSLSESPLAAPAPFSPPKFGDKKPFDPKTLTGLDAAVPANTPKLPIKQSVLPKDLSGAKPRFNMGNRVYSPQFEDDLDKAFFIISQKTPSKRDADYLKFVMESTGLDEAAARAKGVKIRSKIKGIVSGAEPGDVSIPSIYNTKSPAASTAIPANTATGAAQQTTAAKPLIQQIPGLQQPKPKPIPGKLLDKDQLDPNIPVTNRKPPKPPPEQSAFSQIWNAPRSLQSIDLPGITSAALRQSRPLSFTGDWFRAWASAAKSFNSKDALNLINEGIKNSKYFKPKYEPIMDKAGNVFKYAERPSIAEELGVKMTDVINTREEAIASSLAERIPGYGRYVKASNRAYTGFLNDLRKNKFEQLMDGAKAAGLDPETDLVLGKKIADFVNNATGRGSLKYFGDKVNLEPIAEHLGNTLYSPRALSARLAFINPTNYLKGDALVKKEYWKGLARIGASWGAFSGLASLVPGVDVSLDPNNADFGKIRIGNTRIDPGAGWQQLMVLLNRELPQKLGGGGVTASTSLPGQQGKFTSFGSNPMAPTRLSLPGRYIYNQLNPSLRFVFDMLSATSKEPLDLTDRSLQMVLPMYAADIAAAAGEDPNVAEFFAPLLSSMGAGVQTYEKGSFNRPEITPAIKKLTGIDLPTVKVGR